MKLIIIALLFTITFAFPAEQTPRPAGEPLIQMPIIRRSFAQLLNQNIDEQLAHHVLDNLLNAVTANPIVLPTQDDADDEVEVETRVFFERVCEDLHQIVDFLNGRPVLLDGEDFRDPTKGREEIQLPQFARDVLQRPNVHEHFEETLQSLEGAMSVVEGVAQNLREAQVLNPNKPLPTHIRELLHHGLASPLMPTRRFGNRRTPSEVTKECIVRKDAPCVIMKEFFGWQPRLFRRILPIYQEPWARRVSRIIGYRVVWFIRWVPVEYLKTIVHSLDDTGDVQVRVKKNLVMDIELTNFWGFFSPQSCGLN